MVVIQSEPIRSASNPDMGEAYFKVSSAATIGHQEDAHKSKRVQGLPCIPNQLERNCIPISTASGEEERVPA